jgi:hypothetical protein
VEIFTQFPISDLGWLFFFNIGKKIRLLDFFLFICEKLKIILQIFTDGFAPHQDWIDIIFHVHHIIIQ